MQAHGARSPDPPNGSQVRGMKLELATYKYGITKGLGKKKPGRPGP